MSMKTVMVTGSESGMGAAIAERLVRTGYKVIGIDLPGKGAVISGDLSTGQGRQLIIQQALEACDGKLDGIVCNAGVDNENVPLVFSVNFYGVVDLLAGMQSALANAGRSAAVVNVSNSIAITPGVPQNAVEMLASGNYAESVEALKDCPRFAYQVSKAALARWIRTQAAGPNWAGSGINLNGVCPGPVMTPLLEKDLQDPRKRDAIMGLPRPLKEFTPPDQIAELFEFLLSDRARFIVGQLIMIDGGIEATFRGKDYPTPWVLPA
jgi:NAD(P)-dependent dehydrogenase (short-subunit alcohol dehydrogenase family)